MTYEILMSTKDPIYNSKNLKYSNILQHLEFKGVVVIIWSESYNIKTNKIVIEYIFLSTELNFSNAGLHEQMFCDRFFGDQDSSNICVEPYIVVKNNEGFVISVDVTISLDDISILHNEVVTHILMNMNKIIE